MNHLIVCYDLVKEGQDYDAIIDKIETYEGHIRINKSVWLIATNHEAKYVKEQLLKVINGNDRLFVGPLQCCSSWHNLESSNQEVQDLLKL